MSHESYYNYYQKMAHWSFDEFGIHTESLTNWDLYAILNTLAGKDSRILDLGTAGCEKIFSFFPNCAEILGTDFSPKMIDTARKALAESCRTNISFKVMDNLNMDVPEEHFDIVVARHTCTAPDQIFRALKPGGHLLIRGVDKYDCWGLKMIFEGGQGYNDPKPVSIADYEAIINAGFTDVELVPIHERDFFKDRESLKGFLEAVPILEGVSIEGNMLDDAKLDEYISKNSINNSIVLLRNYYGITARKP